MADELRIARESLENLDRMITALIRMWKSEALRADFKKSVREAEYSSAHIAILKSLKTDCFKWNKMALEETLWHALRDPFAKKIPFLQLQMSNVAQSLGAAPMKAYSLMISRLEMLANDLDDVTGYYPRFLGFPPLVKKWARAQGGAQGDPKTFSEFFFILRHKFLPEIRTAIETLTGAYKTPASFAADYLRANKMGRFLNPYSGIDTLICGPQRGIL